MQLEKLIRKSREIKTKEDRDTALLFLKVVVDLIEEFDKKNNIQTEFEFIPSIGFDANHFVKGSLDTHHDQVQNYIDSVQSGEQKWHPSDIPFFEIREDPK